MDSSNYTINSIWLSKQQPAQMCNFGGKHLLLCSTKYEKTTWARHSSLYFFYNNHYTKYVDQVKVWLLDIYN